MYLPTDDACTRQVLAHEVSVSQEEVFVPETAEKAARVEAWTVDHRRIDDPQRSGLSLYQRKPSGAAGEQEAAAVNVEVGHGWNTALRLCECSCNRGNRSSDTLSFFGHMKDELHTGGCEICRKLRAIIDDR